MRGPLPAEQFATRQRYRVPGIVLPSRRTGATIKRYSPRWAIVMISKCCQPESIGFEEITCSRLALTIPANKEIYVFVDRLGSWGISAERSVPRDQWDPGSSPGGEPQKR